MKSVSRECPPAIAGGSAAASGSASAMATADERRKILNTLGNGASVEAAMGLHGASREVVMGVLAWAVAEQ